MQKDSASGESRQSGPSRYFLIAVVLLLAMGLVWSVDASLVYVFLGGAVYFIFLGFYHRPRTPQPEARYEKSSTSGRPAAAAKQGSKTFFTPVNQPRAASSPVERRRRMVVILVLAVLFSAVGIAVFIGVSVWRYTVLDATTYVEIGDAYFNQQQYDSAYNYYRMALSLEPDDEVATLGVANSLLALGKEDSALIAFDQILEINPENQKASYGKALIAWNGKRYDDAIQILQPVLSRDPEYHDALLLMGDCYYVRQRYSEAIPWYEKAFVHEDQRTRILCHIMAYIYDTQGDYPKAVSYYREALRYDSSVVDIYRRLGELIPGEEGDFFRARSVAQ